MDQNAERRVKELRGRRTTLWIDCRLDDFTVKLSPVSSVEEWESYCAELMEIFSIPEIEMVNEWPLVYRGNGGETLYDKKCWESLGNNPVEIYDKMLVSCRETVKRKYPRLEIDDRDLLWLMRHAGLPSPLLDFSKSFYVALWFAIHNSDGSIRKEDASVWVARITDRMKSANVADANSFGRAMHPHVYNQVSYDENGETLFYRPASQESVVICQRFLTDGADGCFKLLPLNEDPYFAGKIVRIPISGDYAKIEQDIIRLLMKDNENYGVHRCRDDLFGLRESAFYQTLFEAGERCFQAASK